MFGGLKAMAKAAGRNPDDLAMIVRANVYFTDAPLGDDRFIFSGSSDQIRDDIHATRKIGADELFFDVQFSPGVYSVGKQLAKIEQLWELSKSAP